MIEKLKKGEDGYELENDKFFRVMSVLNRPHSSERDLMGNLLMCFVTTKRGPYGERQLKTPEGEEDGEKAPKKRKKD